MSEDYNNYENSNPDTQYTQAPEENTNTQYTQAPSGNDSMGYNSNGYGGPVADYTSGKGQSKGLGIASMVCGILSIVTICCLGIIFSLYGSIPLVLGIVAVVLGIMQIVKNESKGMAIAGVICGGIGIVLALIFMIIYFAVLGAVGGGDLDYQDILRELQELESLMIRL